MFTKQDFKRSTAVTLMLSMIGSMFVMPFKAQAKTPIVVGDVTSVVNCNFGESENDEFHIEVPKDTVITLDYSDSDEKYDANHIKDVTCSWSYDGKTGSYNVPFNISDSFNSIVTNIYDGVSGDDGFLVDALFDKLDKDYLTSGYPKYVDEYTKSRYVTANDGGYIQGEFDYVGDKKGDYSSQWNSDADESEYTYVGENQGSYAYVGNPAEYNYVGRGSGEFDKYYTWKKIDPENRYNEEWDSDTRQYIYTQANDGSYMLTPIYTYVGDNNGDYIVDDDTKSYVYVGDNNGDFAVEMKYKQDSFYYYDEDTGKSIPSWQNPGKECNYIQEEHYKYVGKNMGSYMWRTKYSYVGQGNGEYTKEQYTTYSISWSYLNSLYSSKSEKAYDMVRVLSDVFTNAEFTLNVNYDNNEVISYPVNVVMASNDDSSVANFWKTNSAIVVKLADSNTIDDVDFYELNNAIVCHADSKTYGKKYYVDINSEDDVVLPFNNGDDKAMLTKLKVGNDVVYNNGASLSLKDDYTIADENQTEYRQKIYKYEYVDEEGKTQKGQSGGGYWFDIGSMLMDQNMVLLDGNVVNVHKYTYDLGEDYTETSEYNKQFNAHEDDFENIIKNGMFIKTIPAKRLDGSSVDSGEGVDKPSNVNAKFHIVFDTSSDDCDIDGLLKSFHDYYYDDYSEVLKDNQINEVLYNYDSTSTKVHNKITYSNGNIREYDDTWIRECYSSDWKVDVEYIDFIDFDNHCYNWLKECADKYNVKIDKTRSYVPDFENAISDESIAEHFGIQEAIGLAQDTYISTNDNKKVCARLGKSVEKVDSNGAVCGNYTKNNVSFTVDSLSGLDKGIVYNITPQIRVNTSAHSVNDYFGSTSSYPVVYQNGDLVRDNTQGSFTFTEYKYGEMILASVPDAPVNLSYDKDSKTLTWDKPLDEGLGVENSKTRTVQSRTDDVVYLKNYKVSVKDASDAEVYSKELDKDALSLEIPADVISDIGDYNVSVSAVNVIGDSEAASIKISVAPIITPVVTATPTAIVTATPDVPTATPIVTVTPTAIVTITPDTPAPTATPTVTPTVTSTPEPTKVPTEAPTETPVPTKAPTKVPTQAPTATPVVTEKPTPVPTNTPEPTATPVLVPDIKVETKIEEKPYTYGNGEKIEYRIIVTNKGDIDLTGVTVTESLDGWFDKTDDAIIDKNKAVIDELKVGESVELKYYVDIDKVIGPNPEVGTIDLENITKVTTNEGAESETKDVVKVVVVKPTVEPTKAPTATPESTKVPTVTPTAIVTATPDVPVATATPEPTKAPTEAPTATPVVTATPTPVVTATPTAIVTATPTQVPTVTPTVTPTLVPTKAPTQTPSATPTEKPVVAPSPDKHVDSPQTGDTTNVAVWYVVLLLSAGCIALIVIGNKRKKNDDVD